MMLGSGESGQFEMGEELGQGAYATVYKGRNTQTGEVVAIKKMKKMTKNDKQVVEKEINIMKGLKHKNIVEYKTDFRHKGEWYIVLEYCGKGDMDNYKKKIGKIPEHHCRLFVKNILEALVELHKKNIAHRDLKLANILITDDYQLKLADFGFSKDYESSWMRTFCGTPLSMAPEILLRENYNERCDVWSLGVLTYMMIYNRPPYLPTKADGEGLNGLINAVRKRQHKYDPSVQVSEAGIDFMSKCLQKEQKKRPSTKELLNHQWFTFGNASGPEVSGLRVAALQGSLTESPQLKAEKMCKIMMAGVVEEHIQKMAAENGLSKEIIERNLHTLGKYFNHPENIIHGYLMLVTKRMMEWERRDLLLKFDSSSVKVPLEKISQFKGYFKELQGMVGGHLKDFNKKNKKDPNLEKDLLLWVNMETEQLMDSMDEEQIFPKLSLLKNLCKFTIYESDNSVLSVTWGGRDDLKDIQMKVFLELETLGQNPEKAIAIINEGESDNEDLESAWLIEHSIRDRLAGKGTEVEMGKLYLYVLNIKSNFGADRTMMTDQFELGESMDQMA